MCTYASLCLTLINSELAGSFHPLFVDRESILAFTQQETKEHKLNFSDVGAKPQRKVLNIPATGKASMRASTTGGTKASTTINWASFVPLLTRSILPKSGEDFQHAPTIPGHTI